ncbi:Crp/Fnr family transcriptional regulator [Anaeromyxobacter oryzae]|uniref:cAMP-binding protein n=1 Tax=Anaeromyxobacter oryzae TaxID=2918170 RepID=A0ABN6MQG2_9BACT|nr:cyclic nucleotide-binding domain-containing protein [Anaeromyxobacter oryzae]BDG01938.1 cAMP-binding protein [Anaeromyxobacter oryzae]
MVTAQDLKQIFLFKHVPDPVLALVAEAAEEVTFAPGETIATERDPAKALYLIRSGTVRATRQDLSAPVLFGTGESIGQVSILDGGPAGMEAVALERVDAVALRPARLVEKLGANPEAAFQLYRAVARSLAGRLRRALDAISLARDGGEP